MKLIALSVLVFVFGSSLSAQNFNHKDENGLKQGSWRKLYKNGNTRYEGQFEDGKPVGLFKYFYQNGGLMATNNHVAGGIVANHVYHKNGKIKAKGIFRNQLKDSLWQYYNENEILILEEEYHLDTVHGLQKTYYENGQLAEEMYYEMGVKDSSWNKFFEGGEPWVTATYDMGNLHGKFLMYADKNKRDIQGQYYKGVRVGTWMIFNPNGSVKQQEVYKKGIIERVIPYNGEFTDYYENDIPKSVYTYKNGKREGEFKEFHKVGKWVREEKAPTRPGEEPQMIEELRGTQLKVKGWYNSGQLNGKVTHYKQDGSVDRVEVWEKGELVSTIDWEKKR